VKSITSKGIDVVFDAVGDDTTQLVGYGLVVAGGSWVCVQGSTIPEDKKDQSKTIVNPFGSVQFPANSELLESGKIKVRVH
jgi:NADPH:quinone reductase-like Zn-dependent oxidoreductase